MLIDPSLTSEFEGSNCLGHQVIPDAATHLLLSASGNDLLKLLNEAPLCHVNLAYKYVWFSPDQRALALCVFRLKCHLFFLRSFNKSQPASARQACGIHNIQATRSHHTNGLVIQTSADVAMNVNGRSPQNHFKRGWTSMNSH